MNKAKQFGETVEGYNVPVLNEREIRASAGILFLVLFWSWILVIFNDNYLLLKYVNTIFLRECFLSRFPFTECRRNRKKREILSGFSAHKGQKSTTFQAQKILKKQSLTDFIVRVVINPKYSPSLIVGRLIVGKQNPEYVGAVQKKFAWTIGLVLSSIMFLLLVVMNSDSLINFIICQTCLIFLFFESVFGICLGCKFYPMFHKEKTQYCPGEICDVKAKQEIQKTLLLQKGIVIGSFTYVIVVAILFNNSFSAKPTDLWLIVKSVLSI